jgi:NitT/TauT family transport system ATP-binding protein
MNFSVHGAEQVPRIEIAGMTKIATPDAAKADAAIRVRNVSHHFGEEGDARHVRALLDTSLDVERGELLCLIGPSGCGKSTLLNVMGGLFEPTTGTVTVGDKPVRGPMPHDIAFIFQENALFPWNTIFENIMLGMTFQGVPKSEREDRARRALEAVGLDEFADHYPSQLSGGMRQRAALARALSLETSILLMDEPFGALDEQTRMVLGEDLSVLLSRSKKTIVFVTHSLGEAVFLADRVAVFSARPGTIKEVIEIDEPHPRKPEFMTSAKFHTLRDRLYELLHDEIRKSMSQSAKPKRAYEDAVAKGEA